jgi:hypothetical protein
VGARLMLPPRRVLHWRPAVGSAACCLWKVGSEGLRGKSQGGDSLWWVVLFSFCLQLDRPMALSSCNILFFELNIMNL